MVEAKQRGRAGRSGIVAATAVLGALALGACAKKEPVAPAPAVVLAEPVHAALAEAAEARRYPVEVVARHSSLVGLISVMATTARRRLSYKKGTSRSRLRSRTCITSMNRRRGADHG